MAFIIRRRFEDSDSDDEGTRHRSRRLPFSDMWDDSNSFHVDIPDYSWPFSFRRFPVRYSPYNRRLMDRHTMKPQTRKERQIADTGIDLPIQWSRHQEEKSANGTWATTMNVRGFDPNDVEIKENDGVLTVQAKKEIKGDGSYSFREMKQQVTLPEGVDMENVKANFLNGELVITAPRKQLALETSENVDKSDNNPVVNGNPDSNKTDPPQTITVESKRKGKK